MRVSYSVRLDQSHLLDESALARPTDDERAILRGLDAFQGVLELAGGADPVLIEDVLEAWVQNLCYGAAPRVLDGESFEILYFTYAGAVRLEPSGPQVIVTGDHVQQAAFPTAALLPALLDCGDRFVAWATTTKAGDASYLENLKYVAGFRPAAVAALQEAGLLESEA